MIITFFDSVYKPNGSREVFTFFNFYNGKLSKFKKTNKKKGVPLFNFVELIGDYRNDKNVIAHHGLILDFDNKEIEPSEYSTIDLIANELQEYEHAIYTTHSNSFEIPKFRVCLPFKTPCTSDEYKEFVNIFYEVLGAPSGLAMQELGTLSLSYFLPSCHDENEALAHSEYHKESPIDVFDFIKVKQKQKPIEHKAQGFGGRNNALKSQASACLDKGKSITETVLELVEYDKKNHNPPLFEDESEGFLAHAPEIGAMNFVSRIWFSHSRNKKLTPYIGQIEDLKIFEPTEEKPKSTTNEKLFTQAPGLVGEITSFILETAPKPQPALAIGAALSGVGVIKGHRVQTETGLRTNLYILALADAGAGKEHPQRIMQMIFNQSDNELLLIGEPASDSGLLKSLSINNGRGYLIWDEVGHALGSLTGRGSSPHLKKIIDVLLKLFSKANSVYIGKEYGNFDGKMSRKDLDQPMLGIFGSTVPSRLYQALNADFVLDGFLPRWLTVSVTNPDIVDTGVKLIEDVPVDLLNSIKSLKYLPTNVRSSGNLDSLNRIRPATVEFDLHARDYANDARNLFDRLKKEAREAGNHLDALWTRGYEHGCKVALVVSDGEKISRDSAEWAFTFVEQQLNEAVRLYLEHGSESESEKRTKRVLAIIRKSGMTGITRQEMCRKTQWLSSNERKQIIDGLIDSDLVKISSYVSQTKSGISYIAI